MRAIYQSKIGLGIMDIGMSAPHPPKVERTSRLHLYLYVASPIAEVLLVELML